MGKKAGGKKGGVGLDRILDIGSDEPKKRAGASKALLHTRWEPGDAAEADAFLYAAAAFLRVARSAGAEEEPEAARIRELVEGIARDRGDLAGLAVDRAPVDDARLEELQAGRASSALQRPWEIVEVAPGFRIACWGGDWDGKGPPVERNPRRLPYENLTKVNLVGEQLDRFDFTGAYLPGTDLSGARLRDVSFAGADLTGAVLAGADLSRARLDGAKLAGADLAGAELDGAFVEGADLTGVDLRGASLEDVDLAGARTEGVIRDRYRLTEAKVRDENAQGYVDEIHEVRLVEREGGKVVARFQRTVRKEADAPEVTTGVVRADLDEKAGTLTLHHAEGDPEVKPLTEVVG